jgi:hypothetical protein
MTDEAINTETSMNALGPGASTSGALTPGMPDKYIDPSFLKRLNQFLFLTYVVVSLVAFGLESSGIGSLSLFWLVGTFSVSTLLLVLMSISFVTWMQVTRHNLRYLGVKHLKLKPLDAVESCVFPIVNLIKPQMLMQETWKASDPDDIGDENIATRKPNLLITFWWASFLMALVLTPLLAGFVCGHCLRIDRLIGALAAGLAILIITKTTRRQQHRLARLQGQDPSSIDTNW